MTSDPTGPPPGTGGGRWREGHWDAAYTTRGVEGVSWYQPRPVVTLELLDSLSVPPGTAIIDVGGGASSLVGHLIDRGFDDLTVIDVSSEALAAARDRVPDDAAVTWLHHDILTWDPPRIFGVWHDRAVFHFLTQPEDRERYRKVLRAGLAPGGIAIMATFAPDGPDSCSGLPVARYGAEELASVIGDTGCVDGALADGALAAGALADGALADGALAAVASRSEVHVTPSGARQPFTWVAFRRVAGRAGRAGTAG
ncbi:MAG: class I SAM-dependent methyltransferase [Acidimicrobiales bacterium]